MEALLVRERYKVVRVLRAEECYAFAEAVDILDREKGTCLLNIYEGPLLRTYLPYFDQMQSCPAFRGMFLDGESLVTVFDDCVGTPIDQVFYRGDRHHWRTRLDYAQRLLHQALSMADLPAAVSCAAMLSENVRIDFKSGTLALRFQEVPLEGMVPRELVYLTCDQLRKILLPRSSSPVEELMLLDELDRGNCKTVVQLYALWRERQGALQEAYEALDKKNFFQRWCALLWGRVKRWSARRKRR